MKTIVESICDADDTSTAIATRRPALRGVPMTVGTRGPGLPWLGADPERGE